MVKTVSCRDIGFECKWVHYAKTEEGLLKAVAVHAKKVHSMEVQEVTPDFVEKVRAAMRDMEHRWWSSERGESWGSFLARTTGPRSLRTTMTAVSEASSYDSLADIYDGHWSFFAKHVFPVTRSTT